MQVSTPAASTPSTTPQSPQSGNRQQRRAQKSHNRKQAKKVVGGEGGVAELRAAFQSFAAQVVTQLNAVTEAFNKNHLSYTQAFEHIDVKFNTLQTVIDAMHTGELVVSDEGKIAWDHYLVLCRDEFREMIERERQAHAAAQEASGAIVEDLQEELFGGTEGNNGEDHGAGTQAGGDREVPGSEEPAGEGPPGDGQGDRGDEHDARADAEPVPEVPRDDGAVAGA